MFQLNINYDECLDLKFCHVAYPYCPLSPHLSVLTTTLHTVSIMLTTCLGVQKVIAVRFPIWTKCCLTNRKAVVCVIVCFCITIALNLPRHFAFRIHNSRGVCLIEMESIGIQQYASIGYIILQTILTLVFCIVMVISTVYIVYKIATNKFRGRQTERRREERRSILMVVVVLIVFLISEVPRICLFICCSIINIANRAIVKKYYTLLILTINNELGITVLLYEESDLFSGYNQVERWNMIRYSVESIKLFTLIGCLSNFLIYIVMSKKLRQQFTSICKKSGYNASVIESTTVSTINMT